MKHVVSLAAMLLAATTAAAQDPPQLAIKLLAGRTAIEVQFISETPSPRAFPSLAQQIQNYGLYEILDPDQPEMRVVDRSALFDPITPPRCLAGCAIVSLPLAQPLNYGQTFIFAFRNFPSVPPVRLLHRFKVEASAEILPASSVYEQRRKLRLRAAVPISTTGTFAVIREVVRVTGNLNIVEGGETIAASSSTTPAHQLEIRLGKKLAEGREHSLRISSGLVDSQGHPITAKGKVKIAGVPVKEADSKIAARLSAVAAVNQKPVFELVGKFVPLRLVNIRRTPWAWEPSLNVDVGLGTTKSNNSVRLASPFMRKFLLPPPQAPPALTKLPTYERWKSIPWYRPADVGFSLGPTQETDRKFRRWNTLGTLRFDFDFHRWHQTIRDKREMLLTDLEEKKAGLLEGVNGGFNLLPYVAFDLGGHVNEETVENKTTSSSLVVPRHGIFRTHVGLQGKFEWKAIALTVDESLLVLGTHEKIGSTTETGVALRTLRGVHHRGKATLDFLLDPAKHYVFSIVYENGRQAPNFQYLNKVSTGIKVVY